MKVVLYVLALSDGCYYVGASKSVHRRINAHEVGKGSEWAKLHHPIDVLETHPIEVFDWREAEHREDLLTVKIMMKFGWRQVRGGHFCRLDEKAVEVDLRAYGVWDMVFADAITPTLLDVTWDKSLQETMDALKTFHQKGCPDELRESTLSLMLGLRNHVVWNSSFEPAFDGLFWDKKGILPILFSLRDGTPIGSKLQDCFAVLCTAMQRGKGGIHPWNHLFLFAWEAYRPPANQKQYERAARFVDDLDPSHADRQYDNFISVAFPEMRWKLRI
jgi:predicted GIY-YIG superfamily endonuclease